MSNTTNRSSRGVESSCRPHKPNNRVRLAVLQPIIVLCAAACSGAPTLDVETTGTVAGNAKAHVGAPFAKPVVPALIHVEKKCARKPDGTCECDAESGVCGAPK